MRLFMHTLAAGVIGLSSLLAIGCATDEETSESMAPGQATQPQLMSDQVSDTSKWLDDKGHYRPDWRAGINTPAGYPR